MQKTKSDSKSEEAKAQDTRKGSITTPKMSVVMTVYNAGSYLRAAVDSILNQTFKDFELIVVDNQSTDGSAEYLALISDPRLVLIPNAENVGQTRALNIGIEHAQSPYIVRMDADDVSMPHRLQCQFDYLQTHPQTAVVGSWSQDVDGEGNVRKLDKVPSDSFWIRVCLCGSGDLTSWCLTHPSVVIRREALLKVGGYNEAMSVNGYPQDYDLWSRLILQYDIANISEPLLQYRILEQSESRSFHKDTLKYRMDITRAKIKKVYPGLNEIQLESLGRLLEYQPQNRQVDGADVLAQFECYFIRYMGANDHPSDVDFAKCRIELYYLPVLFLTHKRVAFKVFCRILQRYPRFIFDQKFHRKWTKVFLKSMCSEKLYRKITNTLFRFR